MADPKKVSGRRVTFSSNPRRRLEMIKKLMRRKMCLDLGDDFPLPEESKEL